jgi:hypothetical protein
MTTIQIQSQLPFETLLHSLQQLNAEELAQVTRQANILQARRKTPHLAETETQLLMQIQETVVAAETRQRSAALSAQARHGTITPGEHNELMRLVDEIEQINAQRLNSLVQLAQLRQVSLESLMASLEIQPLTYE